MQLENQLHDKKVDATFTKKLKDYLAKTGFDPQMGARPMARLIQDTIRKSLADQLLFGKLVNGGEVEIDIDALLGAEITADNLYNNILVFFNSGDASAEAVDTIFYLDAFQAPSTAVLSTENTTLETGLHLLGNPVNEDFILSKEANSIKIYTITGKTILSYNSKNTTYNVSSLSHGIYYAEATFDTGKKVFKFIKN
jgi:hypothetical protein